MKIFNNSGQARQYQELTEYGEVQQRTVQPFVKYVLSQIFNFYSASVMHL
jgi:hypothetical protein